MESRTTDRYARQKRVGHIGEDGQRALGESHAVVVGVGALGCVSADLLVRAGVGRVTVIDRDVVEMSNLHRQTLYCERDAVERRPKAIAAAERLREINSGVEVVGKIGDFRGGNALELICGDLGGDSGEGVDVIVDGLDNFEARYVMNDCAVKLGVPYVYGGAIGTSGSAAVFGMEGGACLRCVHPVAPGAGTQPTCESAGVVGAVSSIIGSYQAAEAMKILMGDVGRVMGSMLYFDLWEGKRTRVDLGGAKDPGCVCCGKREFGYLEDEGEPTALCGRNAVQVRGASSGGMIDLEKLGRSIEASGVGAFEVKAYMIRGKVEHGGEVFELTCFADGRAIVDGTVDPVVARAVYARFIGI